MNLDKGVIIRVALFVLAWVNSFLSSKGFKTIPYVDETHVAMAITFAITAYGVIKHEFFGKKQPAVVAPVKVEQPTPVIPVAQPVTPAPPAPVVVPVSATPVVAPTEPVQPTVVQPDNQTK